MFSWGELFSTFLARKIMGIEYTCRPANRGGVSLPLCPFHHSEGASVLPAFILSGRQFSFNRGKFSAKVNKFLGWFGVFSGFWEIKKGKNLRYILLSGLSWCCFHPLLWRRWWCPLGAGDAGRRGFRCPAVCVPSLCPCRLSLCCFCFPAIPAKYALFRILRVFLGGFGAFVWVCAACVLCVACAALYA